MSYSRRLAPKASLRFSGALLAFSATVIAFSTTSATAQLAPKAPGWAKPIKTILFPLRCKSIATLDQELAEAAAKLGRQVQLASLSPEDVMLAVGCNGFSVGCLQKIGKMIKAPALILGSAVTKATGVQLDLRRFDVQSGGDSGKASALLPLDPAARKPQLHDMMRRLFGIATWKSTAKGASGKEKLLTAAKKTGDLLISTSVPYARIALDGQPRGAAPLVLSRLPPGEYAVSASKQGYHPWQGRVQIVAGQVRRVRVLLRPLPARPPSGFFSAIQTQTWVIGGAGLLGLAIGIGFSADLGSQQNEFDRLTGNTSADITRMQELGRIGDRDALAANVMYAISAGLLVTAAVLAYLDWRRSRPSASETPPAAAPASLPAPAVPTPRVSIGPGALRVDF